MGELKISDAFFSTDKKHRFYLVRRWDFNKPVIMFIGLNPSTADDSKDDATIRKVRKIAANNGYGGFYMMNLFSFVSTDPNFLDGTLQPENDIWLHQIQMITEGTVLCWGNFKQAKFRAAEVIKTIHNPLCIVQNKNGSPKHPLYCLDNSILQPFI